VVCTCLLCSFTASLLLRTGGGCLPAQLQRGEPRHTPCVPLLQQSQVAVAFLHNCGLVNGDIKPDNLLLQHPPGMDAFSLHGAVNGSRPDFYCPLCDRLAAVRHASPLHTERIGPCPSAAPGPPPSCRCTSCRCPPTGSGSVGVRLVDFGACFSLTETDTQAVGCEVQTLPWRAPEVDTQSLLLHTILSWLPLCTPISACPS